MITMTEDDRSEECGQQQQSSLKDCEVGLMESIRSTSLQKVERSLNELSWRQTELADAVSLENDKLTGATTCLKPMVDKTALYLKKLTMIQKEMTHLTERSAQMKARALKLHEAKQTEALKREQVKELEKAKEEMLVAQPDNSS